MRRVLIGLVAMSVFGLMAVATAPQAFAKTHNAKVVHAKKVKVVAHDPTIYDSTINPSPGSVDSEAFEATSTSEFGNQVTFAGTARVLDNAVVQMDSWGCQTGGGVTCVTTPGATFTEPITLNVYNVGANNSVGSLITSETKTFAIPYQPSADPNYTTDCASEATLYDLPISDFAGTWYDSDESPVTDLPIGCIFGYLANVTFTFGHVTLPNSVIYGIAYNTSDYGFAPYGDDTACHTPTDQCGYDSLNVALSQSPESPSVGSDPVQGYAYIDSTWTGAYCDSGAGGLGVFRFDSPGDACWGTYVPAVQFNAVNTPSPSFTSLNTATAVAGQSFSFTVTTDGVPAPTVTRIAGKLPKGLVLANSGGGTGTIYGTALTRDHNGVYRIVIKAKGARNSVAKQIFYLTLTGGRA